MHLTPSLDLSNNSQNRSILHKFRKPRFFRIQIIGYTYNDLAILTALLNKIKGEHIMKKVLVLFTVFMLIFSSLVYAGGGKNHGSKGQGSTGTTGGGATSQTRGN